MTPTRSAFETLISHAKHAYYCDVKHTRCTCGLREAVMVLDGFLGTTETDRERERTRSSRAV